MRDKKRWRNSIDIERKQINIALMITFAVMLFYWLLFPPRFTETTDDMLMASFSHGYMGYYSRRLVYINVIIGCILKICIMIAPKFPWYSLLQCLIIYASFSTLVYLIMKKFSGMQCVFPLSFLFAFFGYEFFSNLQFTKTAAAAVTAGLMCMFYAVMERKNRCTYIWAGILIWLGSLYRFRIFEETLIFAFIIGGVLVWNHFRQKEWKEIIRISLPFFIVFSICGASYVFDQCTYNFSDKWQTYWDNNALRDKLQNSVYAGESSSWPDYKDNRDLYESLNITENDFNLYKSANFYDPELFTTDVMETLVKAKGNNPVTVFFIKHFIKEIVNGMMNYWCFPAVCFAFLLSLLSLKKSDRQKWILLIYEAVAFAAVEFYFYKRGRYLQSRVDMSIFLAMVVIFILYGWSKNSFANLEQKHITAAVSLLLLLSLPYYYQQFVIDKREMEGSKALVEIRKEISLDKDNFYFYYSNWREFPDVIYNIWQVGERGCGSNCSSLGTWRCQTPTVHAKLSAYGITNPYRDMVDNPNIRLLCTNSGQLDQILTHIREHYNSSASAVIVDKIGIMTVYQIVTVD